MGNNKRRKGRSVRNNKNVNSEPEQVVHAPHSFVIHKGVKAAAGHILELTKDFRKVMEPFTASSLKERKKNTIKDFVAVAGLLHVSHLSIFSRSELGAIHLKICTLPRGPTCTFKCVNFSLARDVVSSLKNKQLVIEEAFKHSPLIVLNNFAGGELQMKLMASMFQNMFPSINLTNVDLNNVRRCVLLNYNSSDKTIDFRHYTIKILPMGISKGVKKMIVKGQVPNLGECDDVSELILTNLPPSEKEAAVDEHNVISLSQKIRTRGNLEGAGGTTKSSVKLVELGPRLSLQLVKIEDGLLDGKVLYHDFIEKTEEEKLEIEKKREAKRKLKEKRKKLQKQNKTRKDQVGKKPITSTQHYEDDDDVEYYKKEVGKEPDTDLFKSSRKRKYNTNDFKIENKKKQK